jgi:hypothetical protein
MLHRGGKFVIVGLFGDATFARVSCPSGGGESALYVGSLPEFHWYGPAGSTLAACDALRLQ